MSDEEIARLQHILAAMAHQCLSRMVRRGEKSGKVVTARADDDVTGMQFVVHFGPNTPCRADPNPTADLVRYVPSGLTPTQLRILEICDPDTPMSGKEIARTLRKSLSPYLRQLLSQLFKDGWLVKKSGGYVRANRT